MSPEALKAASMLCGVMLLLGGAALRTFAADAGDVFATLAAAGTGLIGYAMQSPVERAVAKAARESMVPKVIK